jgi:hypothetical protein
MDRTDPANAPDAAAELRRAVDLASAFLAQRGEDLTSLRVVNATNRLRDPAGGPDAWRVTFKPRRLIPHDGSEIGAGGEWFVDVDLRAMAARLGGLGE